MSNEDLYKQAMARIDARIRFYVHAAVFVAVNLLLWFINYTNTPGHWWARWPTLGWGIGLICHGVALFARQRRSSSKGLRERMIQTELEHLKREQQQPMSPKDR